MFEGKYSTSNDRLLSILYIDNADYISIKLTRIPRFYEDDVDIEIVSNKRRYLVLNDSYRYCGFIELNNAIEHIKNMSCGIVNAIGATYRRGGMSLQFVKTAPEEVTVQVVKYKYRRIMSKISKKVMYSKKTNLSTLIKWQYQLKELLVNFY